MTNPNDFLMGGGGAPSATFPTPGTVRGGTIIEPAPHVEQQRDLTSGKPKFWDDGNPMNQLVVTVQTTDRDPQLTDDDGKRRLFIKANMRNAVADAVRAAAAKGIEVGGELFVRYTGDGKPSSAGLNPPKLYDARYVPPTSAAAAAFISTPSAPPAAAPAAAAAWPTTTPAPAVPVAQFSQEQLAAMKAAGLDPALFASA